TAHATSFRVIQSSDQVTSIRESLSDQKPLLATLDDSGSLVAAPSVRLSVDGPYGSPCMDVEEYRVSMCIATGIGVTPFAALITRIRSQIIHAQRPPRPHRLYFVWICREVGALQWFADLIHETSRQLWELNRPDFLTCLFYITSKGQKEKICINHTQSSWFDARLTHGRPDWFQIFRRVSQENPRLSVDGPYGSPCMDVEEYRVSMCIATGIGVTPFAALITRIRSQIIHAQRPPRPHRLYFVWICREVGALQWFADLIHETSRQLWELNRPDFLTCLFYTTSKGQKEKICINNTQSSWFDARLTHGRPDWFQIFRRVSQENSRTCVGVFYCGARGPSSMLRRCCQRMYKNGASFVFNKEVSA
ncbi:predicted protein, partial [Nematostella vectensis]